MIAKRWGSMGRATLLCVAFAACGEEPEPLITEDVLRQGTYLTTFTEEGRVTLTDGQFRSRPVEGAMADMMISLGPFGMGDLDADETEDAAAVLIERTGPGEARYNLHAVLSRDSTAQDVAWVLLSDRPIQVEAVRVDTGLIHVELRERDPSAEEQSTRILTYALTDKGLRVLPPLSRASREGVPGAEAEASTLLPGAEWKLVSIEMEDEVLTPVFSARGDPSLVFTREFGDPDYGSGRVSGQAGCNRIFGNYRVGPEDALSVSSIATTFRSCPEPVMEIEHLLVRALELTRGYERAGDELIVEFVDGRLRFALSED